MRNLNNSRKERLDYIQSLLAELEAMAARDRLDMVAYLIGMASIEAKEIALGLRPARTSIRL